MEIVMASDHAGFEMKEYLKEILQQKGYTVHDVGTYSNESTDYPDYGHKAAERIESGQSQMGIIMCGSGNGINMTANKHKKIRAALCWNEEIAEMARKHNDANICTLPARYISKEEGRHIMEVFLLNSFEGGRHENRVRKIPC